MARTPRTPEQRARDASRTRSRVLGALASCIAETGYARTTVRDIASAAGVSKATVYEHFADKHAAFLALYSQASDHVIEVLRATTEAPGFDDRPWQDQARDVAHAYLSTMAAGEGLTRCLLVEVQAVSEDALRLRREVLDRYVVALREVAERIVRSNPELTIPDDRLLLGAVGGMNELMLSALEAAGPDALPSVADAGAALFIAVTAGAAAVPVTSPPTTHGQ